MTTQPLEDTVTIVELKAPIKTSKSYTLPAKKYNTLWGCVKEQVLGGMHFSVFQRCLQVPECLANRII